MQISLYGSDHNLSYSLISHLNQQGLQNLQSHIHGPGGNQYVRNKDLFPFKSSSYHRHSCQKAVIQNDLRIIPLIHCLLHKSLHILDASFLQKFRNFFYNSHLSSS